MLACVFRISRTDAIFNDLPSLTCDRISKPGREAVTYVLPSSCRLRLQSWFAKLSTLSISIAAIGCIAFVGILSISNTELD